MIVNWDCYFESSKNVFKVMNILCKYLKQKSEGRQLSYSGFFLLIWKVATRASTVSTSKNDQVKTAGKDTDPV